MHAVEFQDVTKAFHGRKAIDGVSLSIEPGSFTVICGPPKAGKSVLFRLLVGLEQADSGRILLEGRDITHAPPSGRNIGYVPQSFALYPHMSVFENIAYPMRLAKAPREETARRVDQTAAMLSITHLLKKTPDQLSGGEKQRVAVARGLMKDAHVFVLDDPLVGLDYKLRERLMDEMKQLCEALKTTFVYATSDSLEALTLAQSLVVLEAGRLVEHGPAVDMYLEPRNVRSLEVIGFPRANILDAGTSGGEARIAGFSFRLPPGIASSRLLLGIRPEHVLVGTGGPGRAGRVAIVEHLGSEIVLYADVDGVSLTAAYPAENAIGAPPIDSAVTVAVQPESVMVFDRESGRFLGRCTGGAAA
ncbi:ABC transporter ATP-binding protein [Ensifer soli]|uniref:ABC transporter ATP-binding protein n=1 Tax=Ciceribacter sp. sgz301302 TaxID=3342379 RepID=UPI0035B7C8DE